MATIDLPDYRFLSRVRVQFRDIDALGHVNNAVYLSYLEIVRLDLYEALFGREGFQRMPYVIGDMYMRYVAPARLRDELELGIRVAEVGRRSFVFEYRIRNAATGETIADARSTNVMFDPRTGKTYDVPQELIDGFEDFQGTLPRRAP